MSSSNAGVLFGQIQAALCCSCQVRKPVAQCLPQPIQAFRLGNIAFKCTQCIAWSTGCRKEAPHQLSLAGRKGKAAASNASPEEKAKVLPNCWPVAALLLA